MTTITQDQVDEACEAYKNAIGNALGDSADAMRKVLEKFVGSGSRESTGPRDTKDGKYPPFDHMQTAGEVVVTTDQQGHILAVTRQD